MKRSTFDPADLTSCTGFHILGKQGVFSHAHVDHHGVITTIYCDEGEKIWLTYPRLSREEQDHWATGEDLYPQPPPLFKSAEAGLSGEIKSSLIETPTDEPHTETVPE